MKSIACAIMAVGFTYIGFEYSDVVMRIFGSLFALFTVLLVRIDFDKV